MASLVIGDTQVAFPKKLTLFKTRSSNVALKAQPMTHNSWSCSNTTSYWGSILNVRDQLRLIYYCHSKVKFSYANKYVSWFIEAGFEHKILVLRQPIGSQNQSRLVLELEAAINVDTAIGHLLVGTVGTRTLIIKNYFGINLRYAKFCTFTLA